jgi:hypothetical protein
MPGEAPGILCLAQWDPEILCLTERLILDGKSADNASKEELIRAALELMSLAFVEWQRRCG